MFPRNLFILFTTYSIEIFMMFKGSEICLSFLHFVQMIFQVFFILGFVEDRSFFESLQVHVDWFRSALFDFRIAHCQFQETTNYNFNIRMDKAKKFATTTENLNKALGKSLDTFAQSTEWSDIDHWLLSLESILRQNPSPFINEKILLAKRLNQCMNPILPEETHKCVLRIHYLIFYNMRASVENDVNEYIKLFSEDLGTYSLSILPYFTHTSVTEHRLMCLTLLNDYYLDLGFELIPMLSGILKSVLPVYGQTLDEGLKNKIQKFVDSLMIKVGRKYVIGYLWSTVLKHQDCRFAGMKFLFKLIDKMDFNKDEQDYSSSHGFSQEEEELRRELMEETLQSPAKREIKLEPSSFEVLKEKQEENQQKQEKKPTKAVNIDRSNTFDPQTKNALTKIAEEQEEDEQIMEEYEEKKQKVGSQIQLSLNGFQRAQWQSNHEIKLNRVPLFLNNGLKSIKEYAHQNVNENNYPYNSTLVVSALITCLEDESQVVRRTTLDFMFTHLRLKAQVLTENDKKLLVEAMLRMYKKKQISITKKVNRFLFGKENEENQYLITDKNQFIIKLIVHGFQRILDQEPKNQDTCTLPLKILQNFYMQHANLVEQTIPDITIHILRFIFNYGAGLSFSEDIFKSGKRFFENIPSYYILILTGLGNRLIESIEQQDEHLSFQCIQYIDFCYLKMMKHDHGIQELQYITLTLEKLATGLEQFTLRNKNSQNFYRTFLKDTILLMYNLFSRRESVKKYKKKEEERNDRKFFQWDQIKEKMQIQAMEQQQKQRHLDVLENLQTFFIELGNILKVNTNIQIFQEVYRLTSMTLVKMQSHLPSNFSLETLPKWFNTIESGIKVTDPVISLSAIESMIQCLLGENKHPIFERIKSLIIEERVKKIGNDYQNLALEKLWSLLDYPQMHSKIIDLIVAFSKFFPYQFTQTVKKSFSTLNPPDKQASIQRFSHFWRLTGFKYKELVISNRQFAQINKVGLFTMLDFLEDQNPLVRHAVKNWLTESMPLFHRILEPLFFELMKTSCEWYKTPKGIFIIKTRYDTKAIFNAFRRLRSILSNGSYAFLRYIYQTSLTDSLEELKQKITSISESFLTKNAKEAPQLTESMIEREPVLPKALEQIDEIVDYKSKRLTFMDMLLIIAVKYIEGHALQSMGIDFYLGNAGVNTSALQLIETLFNYIDSPNLCYKMIDFVMQPIYNVLNQAVLNKEYITQIQLLNLLRTILFSSSFRKKGELLDVRNFLKSTFTEELFMSSLLNGLHTPFSYVRSQFINFITICIPLIADFLQPEECTICIKHILFTYYKLIKQIRISIIEEVLDQENEEIQNENKSGFSRINELEQKAKKEEKLGKISDNLQDVAKTNEILTILHGVSVIMNYFFDFDKMNIKEMKFQFSNPYTFFDTFKSIVTLGLASTEKNPKLVEKTQFLHNYVTCESILNDLSPVFETALRAWSLSQEYVRIATEEFSSIGLKTFNFQRFNRYNNVLKKLIKYVNEEKQSIWGEIFSIIQPMFYKFPHEICDIYLNLWVRQCTQAGLGENLMKPLSIKSNTKNTEFLMKIIETIIVSNFPMNVLVHAFLQSSLVTQLSQYYGQKKKKKNLQTLDYQVCKLESDLLYFLFVYFNHAYIEEDDLKKDKLLEIWSFIIKVINPFLQSKAPSTAIWILDFVNMCSLKYSPKQILGNERFKSDLHGLINEKLKYIANIASKKQIIFYEDPLQSSFSEEDESKRFRTVLPIPPSLYQIFKKKEKDKNYTDKLLYRPIRIGNCLELDQLYRLCCFKALKSFGFEILQNTYLPEKMHFGIKRCCEWMDILFPSIEDKSKEAMIFAESASQVLHNLLEKSRVMFIKPLKESILKIFNKKDFFICNERTLHYWADIIEWVISLDKNNQTFDLYLSKISLSSSYFTNESEENRIRIKNFSKICFILYCGRKDKYAQKITSLLQKIVEGIKMAETAHPAFLILILFSIRILILKLSQISLNQLFIDIWPMLLAFFMQIFSKKMIKIQLVNEISRNPNLLLAALKLIELISITNLGEFAHHEWIFVHDYFGMRLQLSDSLPEVNEFIAKRPQLSDIITYSKSSTGSPFSYKPYLLNCLPNHSIDFNSKEVVPLEMSYKPLKRRIIVKESFIQTEEQLRVYGLILTQYLAVQGSYRMQIDLSEVEEVIINDFINLDRFIYKV